LAFLEDLYDIKKRERERVSWEIRICFGESILTSEFIAYFIDLKLRLLLKDLFVKDLNV